MVRTAAAAVVEATAAREAAANQQLQRAVPAAAAAEGQMQKTSGRCGGVSTVRWIGVAIAAALQDASKHRGH